MNKKNIDALDEINKGCCMGVDAINFVLDKVEDSSFKEVLERDIDKYREISKKIEKVYPKYNSEDEPHKTTTMSKMMTWYGIEMRTMTDKSDSKLAELLVKGTNMGIIEGRKILNNKEIDKEVNDIASLFVQMQEKSVETLKKYL